MSKGPLVSVLLPCFNAERSVSYAMQSLLDQSYSNIEILALDDGSTDGTRSILEQQAARDPRVRLLADDTNSGLVATLNRGLAIAQGEFFARADADDISAPQRLELQMSELIRRPEIDVVGTGIRLVDVRGRPLRSRPVRCRTPAGTRFMALLGTPLAHASIVGRTDVLRTHPYATNPEAVHTEDYELFARLAANGNGLMNLPDPLVTVLADPSGVSLRHEKAQVANFLGCALSHFERTMGYRPVPALHRVLVNRLDGTVTAGDLGGGLALLDEVECEFRRREPTAVEEIQRTADLQRVDILLQAARRATRSGRLSTVPLSLQYAQRLLSPAARSYIASKVVLRNYPPSPERG